MLKGVPVIVIVELPTGVLVLVLMVSVLVQVGLQLGLEKLAVAPAGRPLALRLTAWVVPAPKVAVRVEVPALPWTTEIFPLVLRL